MVEELQRIASRRFNAATLERFIEPVLFESACDITNELAPRGQRRIIRRPRTVCTFEINDGWLAVSRWPENPFAGRIFSQGRRQRKRQRLASGKGKLRQVFRFF